MARSKKRWEIILLKILLMTYILLAFLIAGFNYGFAPGASEEIRGKILFLWHMYENPFKLLLIIACSILTLRVAGKQGLLHGRKPGSAAIKGRAEMRRHGLLAFIITALVIHLILPLITGNYDLYFFGMPFPWTSSAFRICHDGSSMAQSYTLHFGTTGVSLAVIFFIIVNIVSYGGTFIMGRRWQCSMLCMFNGFVSETFAPAFPQTPAGPKKPGTKLRAVFGVMKWVLLAGALAISGYWIIALLTKQGKSFIEVMESIELIKYFAFELFMAMFFWIALTGRGYCYYCPVGTICGFAGRLAGQRITSNHTKCTSCGLCDRACPMSLEIKAFAEKGLPMISDRCVGCGHCIEACPTGNLRYSTHILRALHKELL